MFSSSASNGAATARAQLPHDLLASEFRRDWNAATARMWREPATPEHGPPPLLFDADYYLEQRPDVREAGREPWRHYVESGWREGSKPHLLFDPAFYLSQRADVVAADVEPLQHYLRTGWTEGTQPHPLFDPDVYLADRPDVRDANMEPLQHYLQLGWREHGRPHALFDQRHYLEAFPDLRAAGIEPLQHYLRTGWRQGARPLELFDPVFYATQYPELSEAGAEPLTHYLQTGWREGARPHPLFDTDFYLSQHPDLRAKGVEPLGHYLETGWLTGATPHLLFDPAFYLAERADVRDAGLEPLGHYLRNGWREHSRPHPLFMPKYYLDQRPDLQDGGAEPLTHYVRNGGTERGDPHYLFYTDFYLHQAGSTGGLPPLVHYLTEGWARGLTPHHLFDPEYYLRRNVAEVDADRPPLLSYAASGWEPKLSPHPLFDTELYTSQVPDRGPHGTPLEHYLIHGWQHGLRTHTLFDPAYYVAHRPDAAGQNPLTHFVHAGRESGARTLAQPVLPIVERLLQAGNFAKAATIHTAFAPIAAHATRRTVVLPIVSLKTYAEERRLPLREFPQEWIAVPKPSVFGDERDDLQGGRLACPPAFVTELQDVLLVGGTRVVVTSDGVLLHDEIFLNRADPTLLVKPKDAVKLVRSDMAVVQLERRPVDRIAAGIVLSSDYDQNYFHWMVEVLPKLTMIDELDEFDDVPILIRGDLHPNLLRALALANVKQRRIIHLEPNAAYRVGRLVTPSDICRTVERDGGTIAFDSDCLFSPMWLTKCVGTILAGSGQGRRGKNPVFLTRRHGIRRVLNIGKLDVWFADQGYHIETFNDVDLDYQILRSSRAKRLVAVTGAAATNMMFCEPGTEVTIMMSSHRGQNPYVWQQLATCFGHDLRLVVGRRVYGRYDYLIHDDYRIDLDVLRQAISSDEDRRCHARSRSRR